MQNTIDDIENRGIKKNHPKPCIQLCLTIIKDHFKIPTSTKIVRHLLIHGSSSLEEIVQFTEEKLDQVKRMLLCLIQHNLITIQIFQSKKVNPKSKSNEMISFLYSISAQEILYRLYFPFIIKRVHDIFGKEGEAIAEEILLSGRIRMDQSLSVIVENLNSSDETNDENMKEKVRKVFLHMIKERYICRVHPIELKFPNPIETPEFSKKEAKMKQTQVKANDNSNGSRKRKFSPKVNTDIPIELQLMMGNPSEEKNDDLGEKEWTRRQEKKAKLPTRPVEEKETESMDTYLWRMGVDQFIRDFRHETCKKFATENTNVIAGAIVEAMLEQSKSVEKGISTESSLAIPARDISDASVVQASLPKSCPNQWQLLQNYITILCLDKSGIVTKVDENGKYSVAISKVLNYLKEQTFLSYVQDRFGSASCRIIRVLLDKKQLEEKTLGNLAMLPASETRKRLYELFREGFLKLQEIPKKPDYNPMNCFYSWSVDKDQVYQKLLDNLQLTLQRIKQRRNHQAEEGKELIARSDQLSEKRDVENFDRLSRALDRLDQALLHLTEMMLLVTS